MDLNCEYKMEILTKSFFSFFFLDFINIFIRTYDQILKQSSNGKG